MKFEIKFNIYILVFPIIPIRCWKYFCSAGFKSRSPEYCNDVP